MPAIPPAAPIVSRRILLADAHREQRVVAQRIVVVEVFVSQRLPQHALGDQVLDAVLDQIGVTIIAKSLPEPPQQSRALGDFPQQQHSPVRCRSPRVESRHHPARSDPLEFELRLPTVCFHRPSSSAARFP